MFSSDMPRLKSVAETLDNELLLTKPIASQLAQLGVTSLVPLVNVSTGAKLSAMELRPERILPPFSPESKGYELERQCPDCHRDGHFDLQKKALDLHYEGLPASYASNRILCTYECFGNSRLRDPFAESRIASGRLIVRDDAAQVLSGISGKTLEFYPVSISWALSIDSLKEPEREHEKRP
jgi:hypothetical protein